MHSNDISLVVISFLSNQKLLPRLRPMQQQPPVPHLQPLLPNSLLVLPRQGPL